MQNLGFMAAALAVVGVCLLTVGISRGAIRQSNSIVELQRGFRRQSRLQALDFDTVTVGPYGNYDAQTWYFHPNGMSRDQDAVIYQGITNQNQEEGRLVPWDWNDVIYQQTGDAPPVEGRLVPWDWDDVMYQDVVSESSQQNANTIPQDNEVMSK
ncbi:hypothetical protein GUITHDRAFT_152396 [Guillardia theta CCMP2712]|uniref:Uncharacterized protein n=1 Tax=Guillardia theta (strain CCMP2712) TaxID=905079 RepID=L1JDZ2_GUITC|nr:hypothetical protein GUITHDRAFT_152396 [Guillardia theta CCMP2712]EKX46537.1 hypothetical protein GUITHDRAFT_152396 [Guillardia theta CCMP2712]|eukprot:XP_005833517.1 hypothetical protein GUITHDRAFT_152396 [Guillardia theta CCMP2712]